MKHQLQVFRVIGSMLFVICWLTFLSIKGKDIDFYLVVAAKTVKSGESVLVGDDQEKLILKGWSVVEKGSQWSEGVQGFRWSNDKTMTICVKPNVDNQLTGTSAKLKISLELSPHDDLIGQPVTFEISGHAGAASLISERALYIIETTQESIPQLLCLKITLPSTAKPNSNDLRNFGVRFYRLQLDIIKND